MHKNQLVKAALLVLVIVITFFISWELWLRNKGYTIAYDDGGPLWAKKRAMIYEPADRATVFIGSSRIKFDLDIDTWQSVTGDHAIQLANVGTSPVPILKDLADDVNFKGKLVIDVTETLFFSFAPQNAKTALENIKYYKDRTPAQQFSFVVNHATESQLVFLDKNSFALNTMLERMQIPSRPGVFVFPTFPIEFGRVTFDRQNKMTDRFVADTAQHNQVKAIWQFFGNIARGMPPPSPGMIDTLFMTVKSSVDKIKARGGQVIFVRTPASGPMYQGELKAFPREKFWQRLLNMTDCRGIYFADYPSTAHFDCPEWSHLTPADAVIYTKELIRILHDDHDWKFVNIP